MNKIAYNTFVDHSASDVDGLLADIRTAGFAGAGLFSAHAKSLTSLAGLVPTAYFVEFLNPADPDLDRRLDEAVGACRLRGCPWLVVIPGPDWVARVGWRRSLRNLLRDLSEQVGVLLEPLSPKMADVSCLHSPAAAMDLLTDIPVDRGGWVLDTAQLLTGAWSPIGATVSRRLAVVQLADLARADDHPDTRVLPGYGCLPIKTLIRDLVDDGYAGWWELEAGDPATAGESRPARLTSWYRAVNSLVSS